MWWKEGFIFLSPSLAAFLFLILFSLALRRRERTNERTIPPFNNLVAVSSDMQQGDPTVLSLRPGGGRGGGSRLFAHSSSSSSLSADLPLSRPHASFSLKVRSRFVYLNLVTYDYFV